MCDHLVRFPSIFDPLTGRGLLWVTAAEGFFFISGLLVGLVRGRLMQRSGVAAARRKLWARAGKLYIASIIFTLASLAAAAWLLTLGNDNVKGGFETFGSLPALLWQVLSLNYTYGWTDFLNYYVVFLLLSPLALWLLKWRYAWVGILTASLILWGTKSITTLPLNIAFLTWQAYFFTGLLTGYYFPALQNAWRKLTPRRQKYLSASVVTLTAITVAASFAYTFGTPFFLDHRGQLIAPLSALHLPSPDQFYEYLRSTKDNDTFTFLFQDNRSGLLRLPLFGLWFGSLFLIVRRYEHRIIRAVGPILLPLGRNSLYVYIIQGVIAFSVPLLEIPPALVVNSIINTTAIALCWLAVRRRFLFKIIPR